MTLYQEESEHDMIDNENEISVVMSAENREKIRGWVNACRTECGGLGTVYMDTDGNFVVDNVFIFRQMGSGGYFRLCNKDRSKFETGLIRGMDPILNGVTAEPGETDEETAEKLRLAKVEAGRELYGRMRFHWHSHVNMSTFWSGTDVAAADDMLRMYSWAIMMVSNKQGNYKFKLVNKEPRIVLDDLPLKLVDRSWSTLYAQCREEVERLVLPIGKYAYDEDKDEVIEAPKVNTSPYSSQTLQNLKNFRRRNRVAIDTMGTTTSIGFSRTEGEPPGVLCLACHTMQSTDKVYCANCGASVLEPDTGAILS